MFAIQQKKIFSHLNVVTKCIQNKQKKKALQVDVAFQNIKKHMIFLYHQTHTHTCTVQTHAQTITFCACSKKKKKRKPHSCAKIHCNINFYFAYQDYRLRATCSQLPNDHLPLSKEVQHQSWRGCNLPTG